MFKVNSGRKIKFTICFVLIYVFLVFVFEAIFGFHIGDFWDNMMKKCKDYVNE